jgi:hypothetical protein
MPSPLSSLMPSSSAGGLTPLLGAASRLRTITCRNSPLQCGFARAPAACCSQPARDPCGGSGRPWKRINTARSISHERSSDKADGTDKSVPQRLLALMQCSFRLHRGLRKTLARIDSAHPQRPVSFFIRRGASEQVLAHRRCPPAVPAVVASISAHHVD